MPTSTIYRRYHAGRALLPTAVNLELRLDARNVPAKAPAIASWPDSSGRGGRDALQNTAAQQPCTNCGDSPTGLPTVFFQGNQWMDGTLPGGGVAFQGGYTFYGWLKIGNTAASQVIYQDSAGAGNPQLLAADAGSLWAWRDNTATRSFSALTLGVHRFMYRFPGAGSGTGEFWLDGVQGGTAAWQFTATATGYRIGANQTGGAQLIANIGELLWYSEAHPLSTMTAFDNYLRSTWG